MPIPLIAIKKMQENAENSTVGYYEMPYNKPRSKFGFLILVGIFILFAVLFFNSLPR